MNTDVVKSLCLLEELETSQKLIKAGFGSLQEIDMSNDFYHLPQQLLASGLERMMKCYIALVYEGENGSFPDMRYMKNLGHDLDSLHSRICNEHYGGESRPFIQNELAYIKTDKILLECIRVLSLFGKVGRYYNLDIIAGSRHNPIDPKKEWEAIESAIEDVTPYLNNTESLYRDYFPRVHSKLIAKLERFVRAIALQFTLGDHPSPSGHLKQMSGVYSDFIKLRDEDFGTIDYRQSARILQQKKESWMHRNQQEISAGGWPTKLITKFEYGEEWPFRSDQVIVELRSNLFSIVNIEGYDFALNGAAKSMFDYPFPHEAGIAILGKSVGPFIDMAFALSGEGIQEANND